MKVKQLIDLLEEDGWQFVRQAGSHMHYKHPSKPNLITVPNHGMNKDLGKGLESKILRDAGLK